MAIHSLATRYCSSQGASEGRRVEGKDSFLNILPVFSKLQHDSNTHVHLQECEQSLLARNKQVTGKVIYLVCFKAVTVKQNHFSKESIVPTLSPQTCAIMYVRRE